MSLDQLQGAALEKMATQLRSRHFGQICRRSNVDHANLQSAFAISYRPGNRSGSFIGKRFSPAGMSPLVVLSYEGSDEHGRKRIPCLFS